MFSLNPGHEELTKMDWNAFVKPLYSGLCFATLPDLARQILTREAGGVRDVGSLVGQEFDHVVLILVDGLGLRFLDQFSDMPFMDRIRAQGELHATKCQFPSTTTGHITTIQSGLSPGQSGIYEWNQYEPAVNRCISPLPWSFSGDRDLTRLASLMQPQDVLPKENLYQKFAKAGIESNVFLQSNLLPQSYTQWMNRGANTFKLHKKYTRLKDDLKRLRKVVNTEEGPAFSYFYYPYIDSTCHRVGPESEELRKHVRFFFEQLEGFLSSVRPEHAKTLLMVTADHGHVATEADRLIYINEDPRFEGYERFLRKGSNGKPLIAGSSRDFFLHIHDELLTEAHAWFANRLEGIAEVVFSKELIEKNYFCAGNVQDCFRDRVGNLVILPYENHAVWWYEKGRFHHVFKSHHGGLTPHEMEIPLFLLPLE